MRRSIILFLLLGSFQIALGQGKFRVGPMVGFNMAKLSTESENISGTARPFLGLYGQYRPINLWSVEMNATYSMRGERLDQTTVRGEVNFIDAHLLLRVHFLQVLSFGTGIGYYHALNGRVVDRLTADILVQDDVEDVSSLSQSVLPLELGFQFQNEATLHFTYGYALNGGFNNPAITFRFPIRLKPNQNKPPGRRAVAKNQIRSLDNGMLLVRLRTAEPLVDELTKRGAAERAYEVVRKVEEENRKIIYAFNTYYDFSEVYFFYSTFSQKIREGDLSSLMNAELDNVSIATQDSVDYFIAEFDNLKPDTGRYYVGSAIEPDPEGGVRRVKRYGDYDIGANMQALVIKDRNFIQLRDPFPYYERCVLNSLSPTPEALQRPVPIVTKDKHDKKYRFAVKSLNVRMKRFRKRANN